MPSYTIGDLCSDTSPSVILPVLLGKLSDIADIQPVLVSQDNTDQLEQCRRVENGKREGLAYASRSPANDFILSDFCPLPKGHSWCFICMGNVSQYAVWLLVQYLYRQAARIILIRMELVL